MAISSLTLPLSGFPADGNITKFVSMCESLTENIAGRIQSLLFPSSKPTISSFADPSAPAPNLLLSDEANKTIHTLECASRTLKRMIDTRLALAKAAAQTVVPTSGGQPQQLPSGATDNQKAKAPQNPVVSTSVCKSQQTLGGFPENPAANTPASATHQFSQSPATPSSVPKPATPPQKPATRNVQPAIFPTNPAPRPPLPTASLSRLLSPDSGLSFAETYLQTRPILRDPIIGKNGKSKKLNRSHGQTKLPPLIENQLKNLGRNPLLSKVPIASS